MITALVLALLAAPPAARTWTHGDVTFEMTAADLRATRGGTVLFSVAALLAADKRELDEDAESRAREMTAEDAASLPEPILSATVRYRPLSVVGPLVSLLVSEGGYAPGAAHPYAYERIETLDVRDRAAKPSLLDVYAERVLVDALLADRWVRRFLPDGLAPRPRSIAALVKVLNEGNGVGPEDGDGDEGCAYDAYFDAALVNAFAFHHLEGNRVAVRIGIPYATEVCRGRMHEIGLLLPAPAALRDADLRRADRGEGLLAKDFADVFEYSGDWEIDLRPLAARLRAR